MSNKSSTVQQTLSLPSGGGAIQGIGETFQPNLFNGTGNNTVPLAISPGRGASGPKLALQYSSGNGNGPFGLGWELSLPRITRKTEKGLPRYDDSDVFVMSGEEDLVPCLPPNDTIPQPFHTVRCYRPRTEGLFARIEQWQHNATSEVHWRAITRDNNTSIYGASAASRIANPADSTQVYEWLLQESFDTSGNHILYEYARDNSQLNFNTIFEQNREPVQLYIRRVYYGNFPDPLVDEQENPLTYPNGDQIGHLRDGRRYAFEVVFDYGDWPLPTIEPHPDPIPEGQQELFGSDAIRADRFSSFRGGFEIRTVRRCRRVLMFHHFAELGSPTLVRSTDFEYTDDPDTLLSFLTGVTVSGYQRDAAGNLKSDRMPPVTYKYTEFKPQEQRYQSLAARGDDLPPLALNNANIALVDLFGSGLSDVLQSDIAGFRFWKNLGGGLLDRPRSMPQVPAGISLSQPGVSFGDMGGDGRADLLVHDGPLPGFFETTFDGTWQTFKAYDVFPSFDLADPNLRMTDLTGDGSADVLITEEDRFLWFECLGEAGFGPPQVVARVRDLDQFPDVFFSDADGRVRLADMSGDGLNDLVLIHNGGIDYWPNLGYGRFGKRVTMANAPQLDFDFDPKRLFLADLNGTGGADLVYVDFDRVYFWFNRSGNSFSDTQTIRGTPVVSDRDSLQFADVFGTGTATLLWSYDFIEQPQGNYKALDFCGGVKPYVLTEVSNNMGTTTKIQYGPSTRHFLEDEANGTPWITKLPFPVQVVDKVEVIDHISKTKLVTTYKYHHGYFDGREREFRGFGRVDQFDSETFADFSGPGLHGGVDLFENKLASFHVPPTETRSWFHTGVYFDDDSDPANRPFDFRELTNRFRAEFYAADEEALQLAEHDVETGDTPSEAFRALRGALLRKEIYARDGSVKEAHPYIVTENRYAITQVQPKDGNNHAVYFRHGLEAVNYNYERNPADPRNSHALTLAVDEFGNALKSVSVIYGRRREDQSLGEADRRSQTQTFITYTENDVSNAIDDLDNHRTPLPTETRTYELIGFKPANNASYFTLDEWTSNNFARLINAIEIRYEETADASREQKRLIEQVRTYYRADNLASLLPLGALESLACPGETLKLAFTPDLLTNIYGDRVSDAMLTEDGGYVHSEGDNNWWISSGRTFYSLGISDTPAQELAFATRHFFLPCRSRDPFGNSALTRYDSYDLQLRQTIDSLGNTTTATNDYRVLKPFLLTDTNGNRARVAFDALGIVVGTALMGKSSEALGDPMLTFTTEITPQQLENFFADPLNQSAALLADATTRVVYDLTRFSTTQQPNYAATIARETHTSDPAPPGGFRTQVSFTYSDGFGREVQKKLRAEAGPVVENGPTVNPRWIGSGWTVFNNKGKPVRQFEPFFDDTHEFRFAKVSGVSSTLFYDPIERVIATLHANHSWEKVVFDPWREERWDVNDTALIANPEADADVGDFFNGLDQADYSPTWHAQRANGALGPEEQDAAEKTAVHAATPSVAHFDPLGRTFLAIAHNRFERAGSVVDEKFTARNIIDIENNLRTATDARDRVVMRYDYDMLSTRIHQSSKEAGERWVLNDVTGNTIYRFDTRGHRLRSRLDQLRRPLETFLLEGTGSEVLVGQTIYGESLSNPEAKNLRGKAVQIFDQAGVVTNDSYDFKGNLLSTSRQLAVEYKTTIDWSTDPALESDVISSRTSYDALNRPITIVAHDQSVFRATFNEATLLDKVEMKLRGAQQSTTFVNNIDYDAKGQRVSIEYGNGISTRFEYDPLTFRLAHLQTLRAAERLQDLSFTYDPSGNVTHIQDDSQQTIYFNNQVVTPENNYTYDAVYRLISATGREHAGQTAQPQTSFDDRFRIHLPHPGDPLAMGRYTESYRYDEVGNLSEVVHEAVNGSWTRSYAYDDPSQIEPVKFSNRLTSTTDGTSVPELYTHDAHGNMITMPHLPLMVWDFHDQLQATSQQVVNNGGTAETTYYVYDANGQRARKVTEHEAAAGQTPARKEERIYAGTFEIYRQYENGNVALERETVHIMDGKQRLALIETRTQGDDGSPAQLIRFQFGNQVGSVSLELDDAGQIITYEEYYPYGSTSYQAGRSAVEVGLKRYRFIAKERDEETGLNYHGARYYAPWLGRWITTDPAGIVDGPNLYQYARSNPIVRLDAKGTDSDRTFQLGLGLDDSGLQVHFFHNSELNTELTDFSFGVAASLSRGSAWKSVLGGLAVWWMTAFSHEGSHFREASAVTGPHPSPSIEYFLGFIPYLTDYHGINVGAATQAAGINQNILNARHYWPTLQLSGGNRSATEFIAYWLNNSYLLNYTGRALLGIGKGDNDILQYAATTHTSVGTLFAEAVATNALNAASEYWAPRIEGLFQNRVLAPRFETLLTSSGETLFGVQTIVKACGCWPAIEVNLDSTLSFSQFSAEAKAYNWRFSFFPTGLSFSPFGSIGKTDSNWAGSVGTDVNYQLTSRLSVGATIGYRGDGNPVNQIETKAPGGYGSLNVQVTLP